MTGVAMAADRFLKSFSDIAVTRIAARSAAFWWALTLAAPLNIAVNQRPFVRRWGA